MHEMSLVNDNEPTQAESMIQDCNNDMLKCPQPELVSHFVRIASQLLRTVVSGTGKPSLLWADPSALIQLRLNSFSSLLKVLKAVLGYQNRQGMTKLDGQGKIDQMNISKLVSLIFDDEIIFGNHEEDTFDDENEQDFLKEDAFGVNGHRSLKKVPLLKSKSLGSKPSGTLHSEERMSNYFNEYAVQGDGGSIMEGTQFNGNNRSSKNNLVKSPNQDLDSKFLSMNQTSNKNEHNSSITSNASSDEHYKISNIEFVESESTLDIFESENYNFDKVEASQNLEAENNIFASWISQDVGLDDNTPNVEDSGQSEKDAKNKTKDLEKKADKSSGMTAISKSNLNRKRVNNKILEESNSFNFTSNDGIPLPLAHSPSSQLTPSQPKLDTKFDFQSALNSSSSSNDDDFRMTNPAKNSASMRGFGDVGSFSFRRRTLPPLSLATIQEDSETKKNQNNEEINLISSVGTEWGREENRMTSTELNLQLGEPVKTKKEVEDTVSMFRKSNGRGRQFRIPKVDKIATEKTSLPSENSSDNKIETQADPFSMSKKEYGTLPQTKKEIEEIERASLENILSLG